MPAPSPSPNGAASWLAATAGLDRWLNNIGDAIGHGLLHMGSATPSMVHVSAIHSGLPTELAAVAAVPTCVIPGGVWCWKRRHHLLLSLRGLVSRKCWRERIRWYRKTKGKKLHGMRAPRCFAGWPTRSGATLWMRCRDGGNLKALEDGKPELASEMACMDLTFERIHRNQAQVLMHVGRKDSLAESRPWPWLNRQTTNFLGPIPAGVDRNGKPVTIDLREHCVLVGGTTRAGKSWWLHTLVAAAMGDKRVRTHLLDGKRGTGFNVWEPALDSFATNDKDEIEEAYRIICRLEAKIDRIYNAQRANGKRTIDWATVQEIDLLVMDEFTAFYGYKDIAKRLMNLIARGLAAGLIIILTTQRPSSKIIDTDFRELFHYRVAFWSDRNGSKMILGDGVEADSSEFSGENPGEMFLLAAGRQPKRCRGYSLTDSDLSTLAVRATALRSKPFSGNGLVPNDQSPNDDASDRETPAPAPFANVAVLRPTEARKPLEGYQRAALALVNDLGPQVTVIALAPLLVSPEGTVGTSVRTAQRRLDWLENRGLVSGTRRAHRPGEGGGARDPKLWSITPAGTAELSNADQPVPVLAGLSASDGLPKGGE